MSRKYITFSLIFVFLTYFGVNISGRELDNVLVRNKRKDEPWIWGTEDNTTEPISELNLGDPVPDRAKPNFQLPGVRISEAKCNEYKWQIKNREDRHKQNEASTEYVDINPVFGGRDTGSGEFPHMGAIGWKAHFGLWVFKCGSSLISSKFVLTAAHCSKTSLRDTSVADPVPKIVRLGEKDIAVVGFNDNGPTDFNISRIILHPQYNSPKKYYDIALMELESEVLFSEYMQPACLWNKFDTSSLGTEVTLTGWGVTETGDTSNELKAATVDIIDSQQCSEQLQHICNRLWCGVEDTQLCAGKLAGGVDSCQGDSGGPLQVQIPLPNASQDKIYYLIGITSFGVGCARPNNPGVYSRVSAFIEWIEQVVWPQNNTTLTVQD